MKKGLSRAMVIFAVVLPLITFAYTSPGKPSGLLNDFAGVLTAEQKTALESTLQANKKATGNEISVVTVKNLGGDTVENFAVKLFQEWGIGENGKDNGALTLVSVDDKQMRIEVGYGLEPVLTDAISGQIIRNVITPKFKQGDYYGGITDGITAIIAVTKGEAVEGFPVAEKSRPWWTNLELDFFLFWLGLGFLEWVFAIMARSRSWWLGGIFGGFIGLMVMIFGALVLGLIATALLVPLGLFLDYFISREYEKSAGAGRKPRWWAGGPWLGGGFGRGGGGFGGFGGGRSGGGGASGGW